MDELQGVHEVLKLYEKLGSQVYFSGVKDPELLLDT